jgi:hypothetical protein
MDQNLKSYKIRAKKVTKVCHFIGSVSGRRQATVQANHCMAKAKTHSSNYLLRSPQTQHGTRLALVPRFQDC